MNNFDDNDWESVSEENLRYFYEEYTASVRKQLLSKNLMVPQNVYDVLYPRTKEALMAKNVVKITDLEENSKIIRDALVAKLVSENIDLEKLSESTRKGLMARNKIIQDANDLINVLSRNNLLSKNKSSESSLLNDSEEIRNNVLFKNKDNISIDKDIDSNSENFRNNILSKNVNKKVDLSADSESARENNISKNISNIHNSLDEESKNFRNDNLSKNNNSNIVNLESIGEAQRFINEIKNPSPENSGSELIENSGQARSENILKNITTDNVIDKNADIYRKDNLTKNIKVDSDLEKDSESIRRKNESTNISNTSNLEIDSNKFRKNNVNSNEELKSNIETDSEEYRMNNVSPNKSSVKDLLDDSEEFRKNNIVNNNKNVSDIQVESEEFRKNNLSSNKSNIGDLLADSSVFLNNNISSNISTQRDLLLDSEEILKNNISSNTSFSKDLLKESTEFFNNNVSSNVPSQSDLLTDSSEVLANNVSANVPSQSDLLTDSSEVLANNVSANVQNQSDLLNDSAGYLNGNVSSNVPSQSDLLNDSSEVLANNVSANVQSQSDLLNDSAGYLNGNVSSNVPSQSDLLNDSAGYLNGNVSSNVPSNSDLQIDSISIRNNLVVSNVSNNTSLEVFSTPFRINNLSANPPANEFGMVIEGLGTSTFLGISKLLAQGIILRQILLAKNKPSKYNVDNFVSVYTLDNISANDEKNTLISSNKFQIGGNEYTQFSANLVKGSGPSIVGNTTKEMIQRQLDDNSYYNRSIAFDLQNKYGTNIKNTSSPSAIGGGFYTLDTVGPKGGWFDSTDSSPKINIDIKYSKGSITDAIRNYNLSRNLYNLHKIIPGDLQSLTTLQQNNDEGFQDLIAKTIGHLSGNDSIGSQLQGNLVPRGIIISNEGAYIKGGSPETMYRPQQAQGMVIGSPESMMAKTAIGNPLNDVEFQSGRKGVKHIMRTIKNSDASKFSINYDVQNSRKYVIGVSADGSPKIARQRFTIANPYKPGNAQTLLFYMQNYSSGQGFYFPPYIQSYSDSYGANWNSVQFLGRPEPVFTYNNSTREGTISFIVLTDYTQNLIIGRDFNSDSIDDIIVNPTVHFTSKDSAQNKEKELFNGQIEAKQKETNEAKQNLQNFNNIVSGGTPESNVLQQDINSLEKQSNSIQQVQQDMLVEGNTGNRYSETNSVIGNINNYMTSVPGREDGDIDTKAEDSKKRIDEMIKNLAFQPAFFSGDKVDFQTKMDFLGKLTRPANADEGSGFSFTRPPVCHIQLGDWWNNDIVVDSVSFNYDEVPWALDGGRVQPMWAIVNISFKFIGPYRGQQGGPVLSDDQGGLYWLRGSSPSDNRTH